MAYIYFLIGTGSVAVFLALWVAIYEHNRSKGLEYE